MKKPYSPSIQENQKLRHISCTKAGLLHGQVTRYRDENPGGEMFPYDHLVQSQNLYKDAPKKRNTLEKLQEMSPPALKERPPGQGNGGRIQKRVPTAIASAIIQGLFFKHRFCYVHNATVAGVVAVIANIYLCAWLYWHLNPRSNQPYRACIMHSMYVAEVK
jgi:hypothetical protein